MMWIAVVGCLSSCIEVVNCLIFTIKPFPSAPVEQYQALTMSCSYSESWQNGSLVWNWHRGNIEIAGVQYHDGKCVQYGGLNDISSYRFTCDSRQTISTWTILNVTTSQHGDMWYCKGNIGNHSGATTVFVQVPVNAVHFSTPIGSLVNVTEQDETVFMCTTSIERPRSTIQWYSATEFETYPIEGGKIEPTGSDILSVTNSTLIHKFSRRHNEINLFCTAVNIDGHDVKTSNKKQIIVQYPPATPTFKVASQDLFGDLFVIRNDTVEVSCVSTSNPGPPSMRWEGQVSGNRQLELINLQANTTKICKATNIMYPTGQSPKPSSVQASLKIIVMSEPTVPGLSYMLQPNGVDRIQINDSTLVVIRGTSFSVKCSGSTSIPGPPSYRWSGSTTSYSDTISFTNVNDHDSGRYTCHVTNTMDRTYGATETGNNSKFVDVNIQYPPDTPILKFGSHLLFGDLFLVRNDTVEVTCDSTSEPGPPAIHWEGQVSENRLLTLINIQANTTKNCTARNTMYPTGQSPQTGSAEASLKIIVMREPTVPGLTYISQQNGPSSALLNPTLVVIKGTNFSVYCSGSSSIPGPPSYSWSGSKPIQSDTIYFINIGDHDSGRFTCHVANTMNRTYGATVIGTNSKFMDVKIHYPPIVQPMKDLEVVENEELVLQCNASSNPVPSSFTWTRSRDKFSQRSAYLNISRASREDADKYTCTARNEMMPTVAEGNTSGEDSETVNVKILFPPDVTVTTVNATTEDVYVDIHCTAVGVPSDYTFSMWRQTWADDDAVVRDHLASTNSSIPSARTLRLTSLSYQDTGVYTCGASNGVNNLTMTGSSFLLVKSDPVLANRSKAFRIPASLNTQFMITMAVYSNDGNITAKMVSNDTVGEVNASISIADEPALKLQVYDSEISTGGYTLTLSHIIKSKQEFGNYTIDIKNDFGTIFVPLEVFAEGEPCSPKNVTIAKSTPNSVTLSWIRCFHGGREQTFVIQHSTDELKWTNSSSVKGGLSTSQHPLNATVGSLQPNTLYYFMLFAYNELGRSDFTPVLNITTEAKDDDFVSGPNIGLIAGGAVGGLIAAFIVIVAALLLFRRHKKSQGSPKKALLKENGRTNEADSQDDLLEINMNPMYDSAGPLSSTPKTSDVYAEVRKQKPKQTVNLENTDVYAEVQKPKNKTSAPGQQPRSTGTASDVYSVPISTQKGKQKKKEEKKQKKDKPTKAKKDKEGLVYENANTLKQEIKPKKSDNVYENPSCLTYDEEPNRIKNEDGLIYVKVELPSQKDMNDAKLVIHGLEDKTDYADIQFGKVGEPAPESDEENNDKTNTE